MKQTEEERKKLYADFLPELPENDGVAYVSFYTEKDEDDSKDVELLDRIREKIKEASEFIDVGEGTITGDTTRDEDWINNWKQYFKSFVVDRFYIKPTWEEKDSKYDDYKMIEIDPGTAFGTGRHETTQLCIQMLGKYVKPNDIVCDFGCGSGILSMVAKKMGAGHIEMTDIDEAAIISSKENFERNNISTDDVNIILGDVLSDEALRTGIGTEYDVVVANILADVIIPLSAIADTFLKKDGVFISSGIIYMKEEEVKQAIESNPNFEIVDIIRQGDWRAFVARKK